MTEGDLRFVPDGGGHVEGGSCPCEPVIGYESERARIWIHRSPANDECPEDVLASAVRQAEAEADSREMWGKYLR